MLARRARSRPQPPRRSIPARLAGPSLSAFAAAALLAGCAAAPSAGDAPPMPDAAALAPAEQALAQARDAQADTYAPRVVDAARRRLAAARDIQFTAARAQREPTEAEQTRIERLVAAAELDARAALVETQAKAVLDKLSQVEEELGGGGSPGGNARGATARPALDRAGGATEEAQ